jgi:hypothetical protein
MASTWREYQIDNPRTSHIVQEGLNKLEEYRDRANLVPAYVLAMGM